MTSSANITTPRFVSAVGGRAVRAGLYTARAGNAGRLTTNNADLLGRLLLVVREVHRTVRGAVRGVRHVITAPARAGSSVCLFAAREGALVGLFFVCAREA